LLRQRIIPVLPQNDASFWVSLYSPRSRGRRGFATRISLTHPQGHPKLGAVNVPVDLETFSIGQIYNFNWRAAKDAVAFWLRGGD
jgi:hypothetical protein